MFFQAGGFALLAAISPTSLLVMAVFLGSANPRRTALLYVAGAMLMTLTMAVTVLVVLRVTGLNQPRQHDPLYGLRLGLGVLALAIAAFMARRRRRPAAPQAAQDQARPQGFVARLVANPTPRTAFAAGILLFAPSATFIAAVQVVATAEAHVAETILALLLVVLITGVIVWLPLLGYLAAPDVTARYLTTLNGWLRRHGGLLLIGALAVCGVILVINGITGLADG